MRAVLCLFIHRLALLLESKSIYRKHSMNSLDMISSTPDTAALLISSIDHIPNPADDSTTLVVDYDGFAVLQAVVCAQRHIGAIAASYGPLFTLQNVRRSGALMPRVHPTRCGTKFLKLLFSRVCDIPAQYPSHTFPQEVNLLATVADRFHLGELTQADLIGDSAVNVCQCLNAAVDHLRLSAVDLSDKRLRSTKASRKNLKGGWRWLDRIFSRIGRLCVLRLDLHIAKEYEWGAANMHALSLEEQFAQRAEFIRRMSSIPGLNGAPLGYIIKSEYQLRRSLHHHVLLIIDGNAHWKHIELAKAVGEFWVNVITKGMGTYYNVNIHTDLDSPDCGIGIVSASDIPKVQALKTKVIAYLCKPDYLARLVIPRRHRLFVKSVAVPLRGPKLGRPRKQLAPEDLLPPGEIALPSPVSTACDAGIVLEK